LDRYNRSTSCSNASNGHLILFRALLCYIDQAGTEQLGCDVASWEGLDNHSHILDLFVFVLVNFVSSHKHMIPSEIQTGWS
jgi:hypothetical protein